MRDFQVASGYLLCRGRRGRCGRGAKEVHGEKEDNFQEQGQRATAWVEIGPRSSLHVLAALLGFETKDNKQYGRSWVARGMDAAG